MSSTDTVLHVVVIDDEEVKALIDFHGYILKFIAEAKTTRDVRRARIQQLSTMFNQPLSAVPRKCPCCGKTESNERG